MNFSLEIGPKTDIDTLPDLKDVYITFLPGGDFKETADKAGELVKKGCNVYARSIFLQGIFFSNNNLFLSNQVKKKLDNQKKFYLKILIA